MRRIIFAFLFLTCAITTMAHGSFIEHCEDMMEVFGFEKKPKLFNRSKDTRSNKSWTKFISSDMIDNTAFHRSLEHKFPGFKIANPRFHRLLFHWGYNVKPWSQYLERHIRTYCKLNDIDEESTINKIKSLVETEQKRRNHKINEETENVFGFAHGGKDASYAQFFASMAYNIHLLGDQQPDNSVFVGVASVNTLVGQIIISLRMLDSSKSKPLEKELTILNKKNIDPHEKATLIMNYLKKTVPNFIKVAQNGSVYRRLSKRGFSIE